MAQNTIVVGDMNNDGQISIHDITALTETAIGRRTIQRIKIADDNSSTESSGSPSLIGTWISANKEVVFSENGFTSWGNGYKYIYKPSLCLLLLLDESDNLVDFFNILNLTEDYLMMSSRDNTILYTFKNSRSIPTIQDQEYVDLGLSSGTLWATCNIGASSPEESGYYFAWGEILPKDEFTKDNYYWYDKSSVGKYTKYVTNSQYGNVDNITVLENEHDAAYKNLDTSWATPTKVQFDELVASCSIQYEDYNNVKCLKVTGPNQNYIYIPFAGEKYNSSGTYNSIYLWSKNLKTTSEPYILYFDMRIHEYFSVSSVYRYNGLPIRPVFVGTK